MPSRAKSGRYRGRNIANGEGRMWTRSREALGITAKAKKVEVVHNNNANVGAGSAKTKKTKVWFCFFVLIFLGIGDFRLVRLLYPFH